LLADIGQKVADQAFVFQRRDKYPPAISVNAMSLALRRIRVVDN
jgi:hypothetical protein